MPGSGRGGAVSALHATATAHWAAKRVAPAIATFREIVRRDPSNAEAHHNLGAALFADGQTPEAAACLERAVSLRPSFESALQKLAPVLEQLGRETEAALAYGRLGRMSKDPALRRLFIARALSLGGQSDEAETELRQALAASPASAGAHVLLGQLLLEKGEFHDGEAHLMVALDAFPDVMQHVAASRRMTNGDRPLLERMSGIANQADLRPLQRAAVHFGLGKSYDDLGEYADAMSHFEAANGLRAQSRLDRSGIAQHYDRTIATYTRSWSKANASSARALGQDDDAPILILGMPRSGTTLIEQILSSHPDVAAGGELPFWRDRVKRWSDSSNESVGDTGPVGRAADPLRDFFASRPVKSAVEKAARAAPIRPTVENVAVDPDRLAEAAADYIAVLRSIGPEALRVTDKSPFNFERIGVICSALPNVRIVHCRRNPVDTCLSIFFTNYKGRQAWTKSDLVFQYRQYERLMRHWRSVLPADRFTEVDYESVVADRDAESRRLIAFCGLPWNDACLAPEHNTRIVKSASLWQARQPTYRRSLERWRNYEPWLEDLRHLSPNTG